MRVNLTEQERSPLQDEAERAEALNPRRSFIVQAPAGSGKTELLTQRFLELLPVVDEPEQILAITFTRAATAEMRDRVLKALERAQHSPDTASKAARAALKRDAVRGWKLLEQPQRLTIQTIDSLCLTIAHETPLLSRLGGSLTPSEHTEPLYALAARRTLARLGGSNQELSAAVRALLSHRESSLSDCEGLIAEMLAQRDQWGRVLPLGQENPDWQQVKHALEAPFRREQERVISSARALLSRDATHAKELVELLGCACRNLPMGSTSPLVHWNGAERLDDLVDLRQWHCLCELLLTRGNGWRKSVDKKIGFPPGKPGSPAHENKMRLENLIGRLQSNPQILETLRRLRELPPPHYSPEQWEMLRHILLVLRYAVAELRVLFAERNVVDFVELGLAAAQVLRNETDRLPPDLARRWPHLLVDEFQDTSRGQYDLLSLLMEAREPEGTCFLVGDPMQSIYGFRQAEVELFERTRRHGLGEGPARLLLTPLQLQMNFRSHAGLVEPLNRIFQEAFAGAPGNAGYRVEFAPSIASRPSQEQGVHIHPSFLPSDPTAEQTLANDRAEADGVVSIIRRHWPQVQAAASQTEGQFRIAVLVRVKSHLEEIARKLREAAIPFRATEIEGLGGRQEVLDLTALVRALLQPMDRIAWLTVLRAPWCALTLQDLHILCGSDDPALARQPVLALLRMRTPILSPDGQLRASRVTAVLEDALAGRHRQASFAHWVERVWQTLGGRECVDSTGYENVRAFFLMLGEMPPDGTQLEQQLKRLFAEPDPNASERCGVQLMTIHKAKGLGFDVVIVPGMHRQARRNGSPLLSWLERTALEGPEEAENREFLVAPIGRKGKDTDPLCRWISRQRDRRQTEEVKRLLYVACTRASKELHLFATATVKGKDDGSESIGPGKESLLKTAWPALEGTFATKWEECKGRIESSTLSAQPESPETPANGGNASKKTLHLRRLPAEWEFSASAGEDARVLCGASPSSNDPSGEEAEAVDRPAGSLQARALGTTVHALLEALTEEVAHLPSEDAKDLLGKIDGWRPRAFAMLRNAGLPRADAEAESAKAIQALRSTLEDDHGRWIVSARRDSQTETSWSAWVQPEGSGEMLQTLRGDRVFRAGAEPGTEEDTHIWIVDYKTAQHGGAGLDDFLAQEKCRYANQLATYAQRMRQVHGDTTGLRLALYYPLLRKLLWWEG